MRLLRLLGLVAFALALALPASAQDPGMIYGRLSAAGGHEPVANATVRLMEDSTEREVTVRTDAAGRFSHLGLRPGHYRATIERAGFAPVDVVGIELRSWDRVRLNVELTPFDEAPFKRQTIRYRRPLVNTEDATLSTRVL
jgi:hypothetical protein